MSTFLRHTSLRSSVPQRGSATLCASLVKSAYRLAFIAVTALILCGSSLPLRAHQKCGSDRGASVYSLSVRMASFANSELCHVYACSSGVSAGIWAVDTIPTDTIPGDTISTDSVEVGADANAIDTTADELIGSEIDSTADSTLPPQEVQQPLQPWSAQLRGVFSSQQQRAGVDLSGNQVTADAGLRLAHDIGLYLEYVGTRRLGSGGMLQQNTFSGGYSYDVSDQWSLSADVSIYRYPNDSVNALAQSPASLSLSADWGGEEWEAGLCFERFFGTTKFNYLTGSIGRSFFIDEESSFFATPSLSVTFASSTFKPRNPARPPRTSFSLSAIVMDVFVNTEIGYGFSVFADPMLVISYQKDLLKVIRGSASAVSKSILPLLTAGLRYTVRW